MTLCHLLTSFGGHLDLDTAESIAIFLEVDEE